MRRSALSIALLAILALLGCPSDDREEAVAGGEAARGAPPAAVEIDRAVVERYVAYARELTAAMGEARAELMAAARADAGPAEVEAAQQRIAGRMQAFADSLAERHDLTPEQIRAVAEIAGEVTLRRVLEAQGEARDGGPAGGAGAAEVRLADLRARYGDAAVEAVEAHADELVALQRSLAPAPAPDR